MYKRSERLRELFLQEVSAILHDLKDPGLSGFLTVTDLKLSSDMKTARVYYSVLGTLEDRDSTVRALERSVGFIRSELMGKLKLRYIPKFVFQYDETPEKAHRIENILKHLELEKISDFESPAGTPTGTDVEKLKSVASGRNSARSRGRSKRKR